MKHGPNALIDETLPVVCIATQDPSDPTSDHSSTREDPPPTSLGSHRPLPRPEVIAIAIEGDHSTIAQLVEHVIYIPGLAGATPTHPPEVVPLQLLAYHIAVRRGCDVDQPRNLAKSVTVE